MTFDEAHQAAKQGSRIRRADWNDGTMPEEVRYVWHDGALLQWSPYGSRQEAEAVADETQEVIGSDYRDDLSRFFYLIKRP